MDGSALVMNDGVSEIVQSHLALELQVDLIMMKSR